jgi:hypothetical protein
MTEKLGVTRAAILMWIAANLLGVAALGVLSLIPYLTSIPGRLVSSLLIGLPLGIAQWMALRRVAPVSALWVLTIPAGLILGIAVIPVFGGLWGFVDDESVLAMTAGTMTIGLCVGLLQSFLLRGPFTKSVVWLLSSTVGLGLGAFLILVSNLINQSGILSIVLVTVVYAAATGVVVPWLPASHAKAESNLVNAT